MELAKIEKLLEAYFKGETNIDEEKILREYFINENVPTHLLQYKPIFLGMAAARLERLDKNIKFPESIVEDTGIWKYLVVAALIVALLVGGVYFSQSNDLTPEEREALVAFEKSKKAMLLLSQNLNRGAEKLSIVNQFNDAKDKVFE